MDEMIGWTQAIVNVVLAVIVVLQVNITNHERNLANALGRQLETCRHYNAIVDCKLAGFDNCEKRVKKLEEQAKDFVRGLSVK